MHYSLQKPATWKMQEEFVLASNTSISLIYTCINSHWGVSQWTIWCPF